MTRSQYSIGKRWPSSRLRKTCSQLHLFIDLLIYLSFTSWTGCLSEMAVNVRTEKAFVREYYTVKVSYTIVPWKKKWG